MVKTLLLVGASAGLGAWAGEKLVSGEKPLLGFALPKDASEGTRSAIKVGVQAASAAVIFGVLRGAVGG